ncbi:MAG TPA: DMT family transporter [Roseiarcus sp.]|nr:DMT family transporter [Roseiarcus sp.]
MKATPEGQTAADETARSALPWFAADQAWRKGLALGGLGVLAFSGTLPATRLAAPVFGATMLTCSRIEIAALLGLFSLCVFHRWIWPQKRQLLGILWTGLGLAVGYPFFIALALEQVPSSHAAVVVGLAPAATAVIAVLRAGERPAPRFWIGCIVGAAAVALFAVHEGGGTIAPADGWLLAAMASVGFAYVEGGRVSRELGAAVTLCWAMLLIAPFAAAPLLIESLSLTWRAIPWQAWASFWYAGVVSMFLGSIAWYAGLAAGGIARIGQLNLATPLLALLWSAILLDEKVTWPFVAAAAVVIAAMAVCLSSRTA